MKTSLLSLGFTAALWAQTQQQYVQEGDRFMAAEKYADAIVPYRKAFDLDQKAAKLNHTLVINLSKAYGATGKLTAQEDVLRYGISLDAADPLFYYLMAHVYAGRNDRENTMKYLRLALQHRQKTEDLPDPRKDDAFVRFYKHDDLRQVVDSF